MAPKCPARDAVSALNKLSAFSQRRGVSHQGSTDRARKAIYAPSLVSAWPLSMAGRRWGTILAGRHRVLIGHLAAQDDPPAVLVPRGVS